MKTMQYKSAPTQIKDVDEKGRVVFYASVFNVKDYHDDIILPGSYKKTIVENYANIIHYKHHDSRIMPGVIQELKEDQRGLLVVSDLIMDNTDGKETYNQYKAMMTAGKSMDHSVGYNALRFEEDRSNNDYIRYISEIKLYEVSTLTAWGANDQALTVDVKEFGKMSIDQLLKEEKFYNELLSSEFSDVKLELLQKLADHLHSLIADAGSSTSATKPTKGSEAITNINFKF